MRVICFQCDRPIELDDRRVREINCPSCGTKLTLTADATETIDEGVEPKKLDKFVLLGLIGRGGFGKVYRAHDPDLDRDVAIKVPNREHWGSPADASRVLEEARSVARLRHPAIVPVYEVGQSQGTYFIVAELIEGDTLAYLLTTWRPKWHESAELVARIAAALDYAHNQGVVHRDIKPGNIMMDLQGSPHLTDFGLALRERDDLTAVQGSRAVVGTPAYMSPEQARGEGHRIDGRTDIYSLGVVYYELLTGRRPFVGHDRSEVLREILNDEPRPPRQIDGHIPRELERICLKAMAKRVTERYTTAGDMGEDLRRAIQEGIDQQAGPATMTRVAHDREHLAPPPDSTRRSSELVPVLIMPKGLRSFDTEDSKFYLELVPGPRDRDGLPDSIRFWKTRAEYTEEGDAFAVGLIYGPSGCGKSSFVKAGLLPRLAEHVKSVFVECTRDDTEARVLKALRKVHPALKDVPDLVQAVARLRRSTDDTPASKTLIVLDQFEQWLHVQGAGAVASQLLLALRQADGVRVQCLVLVRDDFWLATSRFFNDLEIPLSEQSNCRVVDLLPERHARRVLELFGQAYGSLPPVHGQISEDQHAFVEQVVRGLSQDGLVIPIRLSLFADMMKGLVWTPESLREVGGTEGIGVTFLEQTFNGRTAVPEHRAHQEAARRVLQALLPEKGTDIKGRLRSRRELMEESGYDAQPNQFQRLLQILDRELHLISPTLRVEASESTEKSAARTAEDYYQLTHDFLVPALREWLQRKRRETWRGRAELRLEERAAQWARTRDRRFLPTPPEYLNILLGVSRKSFKPEHRDMMRSASRRYGTIVLAVILLVALVGWQAWRINGRTNARRLTEQIVTAVPAELGKLIDHDLPPYRRWADPLLEAVADDETADPSRRLRASVALVARDESQVDYLGRRLLDCSMSEFPVIRDRLRPHQSRLQSGLWDVLRESTAEPHVRFHAGLALAAYAPDAPTWTGADAEFLSRELLAANPDHQRELREHLEPIAERLLEPLEAAFRDPAARDTARAAAASALADFARDDPGRLAHLLPEAAPTQFDILYRVLSRTDRDRARTQETLLKMLQETPAAGLSESERLQLGRRRAGAAITLLRMGERAALFDVLRVRDDPESLTQFVHRLRDRGVTPRELIEWLDVAKPDEGRVRFTLLLSLGEFQLAEVPEAHRQPVQDKVLASYRSDPSAAIHGAAGWLLRAWGLTEWADEVDRTPVAFDETGRREWFVRRLGDIFMTFVVHRSGECTVGSPESEEGRSFMEAPQRIPLPWTFAMADREVTRGQFEQFRREQLKQLEPSDEWNPTPRHPVIGPNWYEAAQYCRWLTELAGLPEQEQCYVDPDSLDDRDKQIVHEETGQSSNWRSYPKNWPFYPQRRGFRLPTEAEWEFACRCGTITAYSFGNDRELLDRYACFRRRRTGPVGSLRPNLRGLFDMHGNVVEWCHNWFAVPYSSEPTGPAESVRRALRGGCWYDNPWDCRSASRYNGLPSSRESSMGFRVVCNVELKSQ